MASRFSIKSLVPLRLKESLRPLALKYPLTRRLVNLRPSDSISLADTASTQVPAEKADDFADRKFEPECPDPIFHPLEAEQILDCDLVISFAGKTFNAQLESWTGPAIAIGQPAKIVERLGSGSPVLVNGQVHFFGTIKRLLKAISQDPGATPDHETTKNVDSKPKTGKPLQIGLLFDETDFFDSEDFGDEQGRLARFLSQELPETGFENGCFEFKWIRFKRARSTSVKRDAKGLQVNVAEIDALSPRFANPYFSTRRAYRKFSKNLVTRCLVLDWQAILSDETLCEAFNDTVARHPYVEFVLADPQWQIPTNAKTTKPFMESTNTRFLNPMNESHLTTAGINFDAYMLMKPESVGEYPFLQTIVTALARQGIAGYLACDSNRIHRFAKAWAQGETALVKPLDALASILETDINTSEERLAAGFRLIANAPVSIWEMLFAKGSATAGPVAWEKGLCVITLHRLQHLENIATSLERVFALGLNCKLVCHGLSDEDKKTVRDRFSSKWPQLGYHFENRFGLGKAISDAVADSDSLFWSKIDDDDDYRTPYWVEIYSALRLSQCGYVGKRASLYHFAGSGRHYAMTNTTRFGKMSRASGHIPGATLSGLTETVRRVPFPRFAKFHMDVAIGQKYHAAGIMRFIGSPFFMRVNRFATGMHTWQIEEEEIAANATRLVIAEPSTIHALGEEQEASVAVLHRTVPGTAGYGFGNWVPMLASEAGADIVEYQVWKQDFKAEPIAMEMGDRIIRNLEFTSFRPEIFAGFVRSQLAKCKSIHLMNMPEIGAAAEIIREMAPNANLVVEIRTPLLSDNEEKRRDMTTALRHATRVHSASQPVLETWLCADAKTDEFLDKTAEIPVSVVGRMFDPELVASPLPQGRWPSFNGDQSCKLLYNGSIIKRRKLDEFLKPTIPFLKRGELELTLCCNRQLFERTYPEYKGQPGLHFVGMVGAEHMARLIALHDCVLSWIPANTAYDSAWSTKAIEAALMHKPVLATDTLGHRLMEKAGFEFIWFKPNQRSLRTALSGVAKADRTRLATIAQRAKSFTWENQVETFLGK